MPDIRRERVMLADEAEMTMDVEYFNGECCDTEIEINGTFCVEGARRTEFADRMRALVDEYSI